MAFNEMDLVEVLSGADIREVVKNNLVSLRWAHVTSLDPLEVRREGEFSDISITGTSIPVEALQIGDKVRVSNYGAKAFIESSWDVLSRTNTTIHTGPNANDQLRGDIADAQQSVAAAQSAAQQAVDDAGAALAGVAETVVSTTLEYTLSSSDTVPPGAGATWSEESPTRTPGTYVWMRVRATRANEDVVYSNPTMITGDQGDPGEPGQDGLPGPKGDPGADGLPGADGVGLTSTAIDYAQTTSGTVAPTTGWQSTVPTLIKGRFLWTRTVWTYTDASTETGYSVAYVPQDGADGDDGLPGAPGVGITDTTITYAQSTSGTIAPTSGWQAQPPAPVAGRYVWTKTVWTYSNGNTETGYSVGKIGDTGAKGDPGDPGADGLPGADGVGLASTTIHYAKSASGTVTPSTGWQTTVPTPTKGQYLWTRTVWTYTDASTETGYTTGYWATDGADGNDGLPGAPGVGITDTTITYAQSTSGTTAPTTGWTAQPPTPIAGRYIWTKTVWTYTDASTETGYSVGKIGDTGAKGDPGSKGDTGGQGISITSVTPYYASVATTANPPAQPTNQQTPPSPWSLTEPMYVAGHNMWRTERIAFSNNSYSWTTRTKSSAYAAAVQAVNLSEAAAKGLVKISNTDPGHYEGRIWWQLDSEGRGIGIKISNGTTWQSYAMVADQILVPSSIGPVQIADGAITAPKLHVDALNFVEATGMKLTSAELTGGMLRTAASGGRVEIADFGVGGESRFYSRFSSRLAGVITASTASSVDYLSVQSPGGAGLFLHADGLVTVQGDWPFAYEYPDVDWTPLTLASGFTGPAYYTVVGGWVHLQGSVIRTAGAFPTSFTQIATMPSEIRPVLPNGLSLMYKPASNNSISQLMAAIYTWGNLSIRGNGTANRVDLETIVPWPVV